MPVRMSSTHIPSEDLEAPIKQGIVTILGADCDKTTKPGSLRRTLSADMSSRKWLQQNGFINKTAVSSSSSSSETSEEDLDEVWRSIQAQKPPQSTTGVWSSLIHSQKSDSSMLPPLPYAPPPMKRSASSLSDKSLQICTESLGSETGSDGFSCYGDEDIENNNNKLRSEGEVVRGDDPFAHDLHVQPKYKKSPPRPFPPPLPSISGGDGASLHMQSHRENGRLVVEAVSVAPRKYFHAQRRDGRLRLTLVHGPSILQVEEEEKLEFEKVFDDMEAVGDDGFEAAAVEESGGGVKEEFVEEQNLSLPTGMISVRKSGLVMKKLMAAGNINPKWSKKINDEMVTGEEELPITQSLPPRPPVARLITPSPPAAAASFNAYEYFWRTKPAVSGGFISPMVSSRNKINQDLVVMKAGKAEQFEPYMRGCKEARRSLIWEPYCIATS